MRQKWREERLDVLGPKEANLHPRDTQARGRPEKPGTKDHETVEIHAQVCENLLYGQARRKIEKKAGWIVLTHGCSTSEF